MYFFFNDTATTEIYTLSLHDALPISLTPVIYGFGVRKELGRRSAMWALFCTLCCVALIVTAIAMGGE